MNDTKPEPKTAARRSSPRPNPRALPSPLRTSQAQMMAEAGHAMTKNLEANGADGTVGGTAIRIARRLPTPQPRALSMFESELLEAWATS